MLSMCDLRKMTKLLPAKIGAWTADTSVMLVKCAAALQTVIELNDKSFSLLKKNASHKALL